MVIVPYNDAITYTTKDGSQIRELMNSANSSARKQSLAEATVAPGATTMEHYHAQTEEIYYILQGDGRMRLNGEEFAVTIGDSIAIPPGSRHNITNIGETPLVFLCCCAPPYSHDDTFLVQTNTTTEAQRHREF